jgi:hypothetical protein
MGEFNRVLDHYMANFSTGLPPIEFYRASIESEVGRPAFARAAQEQNMIWL